MKTTEPYIVFSANHCPICISLVIVVLAGRTFRLASWPEGMIPNGTQTTLLLNLRFECCFRNPVLESVVAVSSMDLIVSVH